MKMGCHGPDKSGSPLRFDCQVVMVETTSEITEIFKDNSRTTTTTTTMITTITTTTFARRSPGRIQVKGEGGNDNIL